VVVQHGEKVAMPGDPGLTAAGHRQATARAARFALGRTPVGVWSSPMRRARETAAPIAAVFGLEVVIDARLQERMNWTDSESQSIEEFDHDWKLASDDRSYQPRSGDSSTAAAERFLAVLDELAATHLDGVAIVVAHGGVTTDALRTLLGDDELLARAPTLIDNGVPSGAVTTLRRDANQWSVKSIADTDHRPGEH
jgi:probable phosphoglycerate mutase